TVVVQPADRPNTHSVHWLDWICDHAAYKTLRNSGRSSRKLKVWNTATRFGNHSSGCQPMKTLMIPRAMSNDVRLLMSSLQVSMKTSRNCSRVASTRTSRRHLETPYR